MAHPTLIAIHAMRMGGRGTSGREKSVRQFLAAGLRQEQEGDEAEAVARGRQRQSVAQSEARRGGTDRDRPDRADPSPDVVAEPLSRAAQLGRIELGEVDSEPAEDARAEEARLEADGSRRRRAGVGARNPLTS